MISDFLTIWHSQNLSMALKTMARVFISVMQDYLDDLSAQATLPLPRVGFMGRLQGPDFDIASDTDSVGNGTHIPDAYLGLGFSIGHVRSGLSLDIGATLYSYVLEPVGHEDIAPPVFITISKSF